MDLKKDKIKVVILWIVIIYIWELWSFEFEEKNKLYFDWKMLVEEKFGINDKFEWMSGCMVCIY